MMEVKYLCDYPEYADAVVHWIYGEFAVKDHEGIALAKVKAVFHHTHLDSFPITLIAIVDDKCVGAISLFENDLKNQQVLSPWLASLYVVPEYRSRGIAKKLIDEVKAIAKKLGFEILYLRTEEAAEYYKKLGWIFVAKTQDEKGKATNVFKARLPD